MTKAEQIRQLKAELENYKKRLDHARTVEIMLLEQLIQLKKERDNDHQQS